VLEHATVLPSRAPASGFWALVVACQAEAKPASLDELRGISSGCRSEPELRGEDVSGGEQKPRTAGAGV